MNLVRTLPLFAVLAGLAALAVVLGRALAQLCSIRLLQQRKPEATLGCAFLGTAALALLFGYGSHAGLPGRTAGPIAFGVAGLLVAAAVWRARSVAFLLPMRPTAAAAGVAACLAVRAIVCMMPTAVGNVDPPCTDATNYMTLAEWLQDHGFGKKWAVDPHQPYTGNVVTLQTQCHRTGAIFVHALLKSVAPRSLTIWHLFVVVMAWGAVLNIAGVYLLCRWGVRLSRPYSCLAAFVAAAGCNSLDYPCTTGFLSQVWGTAAVGFLTALLAVLARRRSQTRGSAFLLGVSAAMMVAFYPEMAPVVLAAGAAFVLVAGRRALAAGYGRRFLGFLGCSALILGLVGNVEIFRAYNFLKVQMGAKGDTLVPWTLTEFGAFTVGNLPVRPWTTPFLHAQHTPLLVVLTGVAAVGLGVLLWRRRLLLLLPLAVIACLFAYFATSGPHPGGQTLAHTWNLFKLAQWSFPFVAVVVGAGLAAVLSCLPQGAGAGFAAGTLCALLAQYSVTTHLAVVGGLVTQVQASLGSRTPLADMHKFRRQLGHMHPSSIYFIHEPDGPWPRSFFPTLFYPQPVLSPWKDCIIPGVWEDHVGEATRGTLFLVRGAPPFTPPRARLPFDFCAVDGTRPLIFQLTTANGLGDWGSSKGAWVGNAPARFGCFSPRAANVVLTFAGVPGPCLPETPRRTLKLVAPDGKVTLHTMTAPREERVSIPLTLPAGVSHFDLACIDAPTKVFPQDPRTMLVAVLDAKLAFAP